MWRTIIPVRQRSDLMLAARGPMADGGPWLVLSGVGCALLVEVDGRWKATMEGKIGHPAEFSTPKSNRIDIFLNAFRN